MPVHPCKNGKFRIGRGKCIYDTKESAERAYKGYLASLAKKSIREHFDAEQESTPKK